MNFFITLTTIALGLIACLSSLAQAGGDKSAKTTVITLAGGGEKSSGYPIPIPVPFCAGRMQHGGHGGHYGAQARMGWNGRR